MGSFIEINDTLQITSEQGFPTELNYEKHLKNNIKLDSVNNKIFEFKNKSNIRLYKAPPVRNFLVQNIGWKWLYWWLIHILEINHDYINNTTSWKYKIIYINTPEEMKSAFDLIDRNPDTNFFN